MRANRSFIVIGLIILIAVIGTGWYIVSRESVETETQENRSSEETTQPTEGAADAAAEPEEGAVAPIVYRNEGFSPAQLSASTGTELLIRNESSISLQFSSDPHPAHTDNRELNARAIQPGESVTITVEEIGRWGFHNHFRETHRGTLTVE
ncbi:MAG: cupredoxin domain-containing protein [Candidatus Saccharimonadales bacterium]